MASIRSQMTKERSRIRHQLKRMIKAGYAVDIDLSWSYDASAENLSRLKALSSSAIYQSSYWFNPLQKEVMTGDEAVKFRRTKAWKEYNTSLQEDAGSEMYNVIESVEETITEGMNYHAEYRRYDFYAKGVRRRATELSILLSMAITRDGYDTVARRMQIYADIDTTVYQRIWDSKEEKTEHLMSEIATAINGSQLDVVTRKNLDDALYQYYEGEN